MFPFKNLFVTPVGFDAQLSARQLVTCPTRSHPDTSERIGAEKFIKFFYRVRHIKGLYHKTASDMLLFLVGQRRAENSLIWYNHHIMNEEQSMFAEMLGIKKQAQSKPVQVVRSVSKHVVDPVTMVDELDVQREVVEAMALEKAELEEARFVLEQEKLKLEQEKRSLEMTMATLEIEKAEMESAKQCLEMEKRSLELEKKSLEERVAAMEADFAGLKSELESARAGNDELEEKLARMGRSLAAARRLAAESSGQRSIGGGR